MARNIDPYQIAKLITEDVDEYAGLEDADEFEEVPIDRPHGEHPVFGPCDCDECQVWAAAEAAAIRDWERNQGGLPPNPAAGNVLPENDEYGGLEDADEFEETETCENFKI